MRPTITFLTSILFSVFLSAQVPDKMSYQAIIRNASGELVRDQHVGMKISILQGSDEGTVVYSETQSPTTNANGLVSIEIGDGTVVSGDFTAIDWANGPYFIKTETDPAGNTSYTITGTSQLLSIPYALHAKTAETITGGITESQISDLGNYIETETDPSVPTGTQTGEMQYWNGTAWVIVAATKNEGATLQMIGGVPIWVGGTPPSTTHTLNLNVSEGSGTVSGAGEYEEGAEVTLTATANSGFVFVNWTGDTDYIVNANAASTTITMPAYDIELMANFEAEWTWDTETKVVEVTNPATGKTWMDRNLGASRAATSSTDAEAYGDLYQWGREADGHQKRNSGTTSTLSNTDTPGHGNFITINSSPYDWRSSQNNNLWQGVNGVNNPCPQGYRLPTEAELNAERLSWNSNNSAGAFASPLKLPVAGRRSFNLGSLYLVGSYGYYWSSTVDGPYSRYMYFISNYASVFYHYRTHGFSVRCFKD